MIHITEVKYLNMLNWKYNTQNQVAHHIKLEIKTKTTQIMI